MIPNSRHGESVGDRVHCRRCRKRSAQRLPWEDEYGEKGASLISMVRLSAADLWWWKWSWCVGETGD